MTTVFDPQGLPLAPGDATAAYGVAPGPRPAPPMLDLRGHDGTSFALPYVHLRSVAFDPTGGVALEFLHHRVSIRGRNLRTLYDTLVAHRATYVQESDLDVVSESAPFVDTIVVERVGEAV